jgi:hypothetical protein
MSMRAFTGAGPKAENSGQKTAPRFQVPSAVEFRHAPEEGENALGWAYSERLQRVGEAVAEFRELAVAVILDRLFLGDPS